MKFSECELRVTCAKSAARALGVSRQRVWQLANLGILSRVMLDGQAYIGSRSLELLLAHRAEKAERDGK